MKLIRFGPDGQERPGVVSQGGAIHDVSEFTSDYTEEFFESGGVGKLQDWLEGRLKTLAVVSTDERIGPPVARCGKIICVGLNFVDHAEETGMELPEEPVLFFKATSAICGPNDGLLLPRGGDKTDWEVELAVVIGRTARYIDEADAMDYVAGFVLHNDYSERAFQLERSGQWVKGKSCDTFAPIGPWLVTPDEIADHDQLGMWLSVNGEKKQDSSSSNLAFKVPFLVSYISQFMSLQPGDIISTGTPPGVGMGQDPPEFLQAGDIVELGIDGLGTQRQEVRAEHA